MPMELRCPHCSGVVVVQQPQPVEALLTAYSQKAYHDDWSAYTGSGDGFCLDVPGLGSVEVVEHRGGDEETYGHHQHLVFKVLSADGRPVYYRKTGSYDSYDGSVWDGPFEEVEMKTRMLNTYEPVR